MYSIGVPEFTYCLLTTSKVKEETYIFLQLSLQLGKKRFSLGRENKENYKKAIAAASEVDTYCSQCQTSKQPIDINRINAIVKAIKKPLLTIVQTPKIAGLWQDYVKFHLALGCWGEAYIRTHIARITSFVNDESFPNDLDKPSEIFQWFLDGKRSAKTAKDRFKLVVAAVDWSSKNDRIPRAYGLKWRDCLSSISGKLKTEKKVDRSEAIDNEEAKIDPFTVKEVEQILEALRLEVFSRYRGRHRQYYNYIKFLWLTGCRPSEAIALKWDNVDLKKKRIKFCEGYVESSGKIVKKKGTKTVPFRHFPINSTLYELLSSLPRDNEYVFTGIDGEPIRQHALNRIWQGLLPKLGIKYRVPYQLRHGMISYHANQGFPITQLATIVGNSEKVIKDHYLKIDISLINVPTID
jgi:integrase